MYARFVMDPDFLSGVPTDSLMLAQWWMQTSPHQTVYVLDDAGHYLGLVKLSPEMDWDTPGTLADHMIPAHATVTIAPEDEVESLQPLFSAHADWPSIAVVDSQQIMRGVITRDVPMAPRKPALNYERAQASGMLAAHLVEVLHSGLLIVDANGVVRLLNPYGAELLGVEVARVLDYPYEELAQHLFSHMRDYLRSSAVPKSLSGEVDHGDREFVIQNGRHVRFSFGTMRDHNELVAIVITFVDVTELRQAEQKAADTAREAEMAFGLALPNSKVEAKLKTSPEYQDSYDPLRGRATVTAIIPDGTYWHVVNGLRIMAELKDIGVFQLVGLDKDTMVQAFIFHDLGKEQPRLTLGQSFVPGETFEPGPLHAARSADWAAKDYHVSPDVQWIIRYHHTPESELPNDFPAALKPMWRLLRLIDGLSAGITRRKAKVAPITRDGTTLTIREDNDDLRYRRAYTLSIYTGEERPLSW
jgi:PAS domain-containing protein